METLALLIDLTKKHCPACQKPIKVDDDLTVIRVHDFENNGEWLIDVFHTNCYLYAYDLYIKASMGVFPDGPIGLARYK